MSQMVVCSSALTVTDGRARLGADLRCPDGTHHVWFECDAQHADKLTPGTCDSFAVIGLIVAMRKGWDMKVEGPLSCRLYYNMSSYLMELLHTLVPGTRKIGLTAPHLTRTRWGGEGVFTGFSGGIDSFCTLVDHTDSRVPAEYRVTGLFFNNVGSHGQTEQDSRIFRERYARLAVHANALGLPFIAVDSNMDAFIGMDFQLTHTLRNIAVALAFQKTCGVYLYSSTVHYRDAYVRETYDMAYADAIVVNLLSTETMSCISSGGQHTRFDKTAVVASSAATHTSLDVCVASSHAAPTLNCSKCWKCLRTELTLEVLGSLDAYAPVFDLATYRRFRWLQICNVWGSPNPLLREIKEAIRQRNFPIPRSARWVAFVVPNALVNLTLETWAHAGTSHPLRIGLRVGRRMAGNLRHYLRLRTKGLLSPLRKRSV